MNWNRGAQSSWCTCVYVCVCCGKGGWKFVGKTNHARWVFVQFVWHGRSNPCDPLVLNAAETKRNESCGSEELHQKEQKARGHDCISCRRCHAVVILLCLILHWWLKSSFKDLCSPSKILHRNQRFQRQSSRMYRRHTRVCLSVPLFLMCWIWINQSHIL